MKHRDHPTQRQSRQDDERRNPGHVVARVQEQLPLPLEVRAEGRVGRRRRRDDDLRVGDDALDGGEVGFGVKGRANKEVLRGRKSRDGSASIRASEALRWTRLDVVVRPPKTKERVGRLKAEVRGLRKLSDWTKKKPVSVEGSKVKSSDSHLEKRSSFRSYPKW